MFLEFALLIMGSFILVKSSKAGVKSSIITAKALGIGELFIGFALLAFATSLPEFMVNIISILDGEPVIGISTLIGSSISDITLVFAAMGIVASFAISKNDLDEISEILLLACILGVFVFVLGEISVVFGIFALCLFFLFTRKMAKKNMHINGAKSKGIPTLVALTNISKIIIYALIVVASAYAVTTSAARIASHYSIMESFIGAAIIGLGSSLPELSVSVQAIRRKNVDLAIGNAIGSLMVNLGFVLGITAVFSPVFVDVGTKTAILFMIAASAVLYAMLRSRKFDMKKSLIMILVYIAFWVTMFIVGVL